MHTSKSTDAASQRKKNGPRYTRPPRAYFPTTKAGAAAEAAAARGAVDTQRHSAPSHAQCQPRHHGVRGAAVISAPSAASPKERGWVRRDQEGTWARRGGTGESEGGAKGRGGGGGGGAVGA